MSMNYTRTSMSLGLGLLVLSGAGMVGCRGERTDKPPRQLFPDMDDQEHFRPQAETEFFADGRSQRPSVPGTVGYGRAPIDHAAATEAGWADEYNVQRARLLKEDQESYFGTTDAPSDDPSHYVENIPGEVTMDMIRLGQKNFEIHCAVCHGFEGNGTGPVGQRFAVKPANFHEEKYSDPSDVFGRDGYIFHVARNGLYGPTGNLRMPGQGHALDEQEAWAVVSYIRTLQASRGVSVDSDLVPGAERNRLLEQKGTPVGDAGQSVTDGEAIAEGGEQ